MDAYVLVRTQAGRAEAVMNALVDSGVAARAAVITGEWDVVGRIENVSFEDLAGRLLTDLGRIDGITATATSIAVSPAVVGLGPDTTMPIKVGPTPGGVTALSFVTFEPGSGADAVRALTSSESVLALRLLTGAYDAILQLHGESSDVLVQTVLDEIQSVSGVASTETAFVLRATELDSSG